MKKFKDFMQNFFLLALPVGFIIWTIMMFGSTIFNWPWAKDWMALTGFGILMLFAVGFGWALNRIGLNPVTNMTEALDSFWSAIDKINKDEKKQ